MSDDTHNGPQGPDSHDRRGQFAPGNSARTQARVKRRRGMSRRIAQETQDGLELVDIALEIARDKGHRDRLKAVDWLDVRLNGKPPERVEVTGKDGQPLNPLAKVDVSDLLALAKAQTPEGT